MKETEFMSFSARQSNGIVVEFNGTKVVFDSTRKTGFPLLVTHAHGDHCKGLRSKETYCTHPTLELAGVKKAENHYLVEFNRPFEVVNAEVTAYNSGHILGSAQYKVTTDSESLVYTGDLNFRDTLITKRAETVPCDVLIMESTYGTPCYFPSREYMYERIVDWTTFSTKRGRIPAFQTDALGNAQELIALLNLETELPVITHPRVSKYNEVYRRFGYDLHSFDEKSDEALDISRRGNYVLIAPKNVDLRTDVQAKKLDLAFVSGWGSRFSGRRKAFCLSDHSDFYRLLDFVEEVAPRKVLTCHGSHRSKGMLAKKIESALHIKSMPLKREPSSSAVRKHVDLARLETCVEEIMANVKPGFIYPKGWLVSATCNGLRRFTKGEVETGLSASVKQGRLRYLHETDSFELKLP
jgi:putative mRNA 3-end processing factor